MSYRRIIRHTVPVDDKPHPIAIPVGMNAILSVACRRTEEVDFWTMDDPSIPTRNATFIVVGTGHPIAPNWHWVSTCVAPGGGLVWHLMEVRGETP